MTISAKGTRPTRQAKPKPTRKIQIQEGFQSPKPPPKPGRRPIPKAYKPPKPPPKPPKRQKGN
ncbi:MAG: hypothetical protein ISS41_07035 [Candidatus Aminicenantes bacterium]|nr:hypothetical protein [Candidatus Aminicenantes bacterium]